MIYNLKGAIYMVTVTDAHLTKIKEHQTLHCPTFFVIDYDDIAIVRSDVCVSPMIFLKI